MQKPIKLADLDDLELTASQGFRAMAKFLLGYFERTNGMGAVRTLVGDVETRVTEVRSAPSPLQECVMAVLAEDG